MPTNDVQLTITDGALGNTVVPSASTMAIVGCCSKTFSGILSTRSKTAVVASAGYGPAPELACAIIDAGGTALLVQAPTTTQGAVKFYPAALTSVTSTGSLNPDVLTKSAHGLTTGQVVVISGMTTDTAANGTWPVTVLTANTFSIPTTGTGSGSGGTVTPTGVTFTGTGTTTPTVTGNANDDYEVVFLCTTGGAVGTGPINFQISLDAGRTYGPVLQLGTATTYVIPQTGLTLNFVTAKTLVAGDTFNFQTSAPLWGDSGVSAAITLLQNSTYTWGAGIYVVGNAAGSDATAIEGYLDTLATGYVYTFAWLDARDYAAADATESAWMTAILSDYSATSCVRVVSSAGRYNQPSSITNLTAGGLPRYRRSAGWAAACRSVQLNSPQTLISRVSDGPLGKIIVNPTVDPTDGYIYHDERKTPGLGSTNGNTGRFLCLRSRIGYGPAFFVDEPWMLAPAGSDYNLLPYRQVMDIGSTLTHQTLQQFINSSVRLNPNGTIVEKNARYIEGVGNATYTVNMTNQGMISSSTFVLSRTDNIATTKTVTATGRFVALGYILEIDVSLGYQSPFSVVGS